MGDLLYQFGDRQSLSLFNAAFAASLRDRSHVRKAAGGSADAWADYAGPGGMRRVAFATNLQRGTSAHVKVLDAQTDWRDRLLLVAAFWRARPLTSLNDVDVAPWPGHVGDSDFESLGLLVGYTEGGMPEGAGVGVGHIRLATGLHLYARESVGAGSKTGALMLDLAPTATVAACSVAIVVLWASEQIGGFLISPTPVPVLVAADGQTIAPADLNRLQDPAMLDQVRGGIPRPAAGTDYFESDATPLGIVTRGPLPTGDAVAVPATSTKRTHEHRQKTRGAVQRFFACTLAPNVERVIDDSVDWRQRFLVGVGRRTASDVRPGVAGDTGHNSATQWESAGHLGPGIPSPRSSFPFGGAGTIVAPPTHALFLDGRWISLFADATTGALMARNMSGATVYLTGLVVGTFELSSTRPLEPYPFGNSLSFDGTDDYVTIPNSTSLVAPTYFTFDCWVKWDGGAGSDVILSKGPNPAAQIVLRISTGTTLRCSIGTGADYGEVAVFSFGDWHHVCAVYDGLGSTNADRLKLYVDGVLQTLSFNGTIPASIIDGSEPLELGRWAGASYFDGQLDEVAYYSVPLTASEVGRNLQRRRVLRGLVSWWKLDEATGTTAADTAQRYVERYEPAATPPRLGTAAQPPNDGTVSGATWVPHP